MGRDWVGPALRVALFGLTGFVGLLALGFALSPLGSLVSATLSVFGAAAMASALVLRIYGGGRLAMIGLGWHGAALRHLGYGLGLGSGGIVLVLGVPLLLEIQTSLGSRLGRELEQFHDRLHIQHYFGRPSSALHGGCLYIAGPTNAPHWG